MAIKFNQICLFWKASCDLLSNSILDILKNNSKIGFTNFRIKKWGNVSLPIDVPSRMTVQDNKYIT